MSMAVEEVVSYGTFAEIVRSSLSSTPPINSS